MASPSPVSEAPALGGLITEPLQGPKTWSIGTLRYTKPALFMLFFWLLWNDLCLMLMEQVAPVLTPLLLKDLGATNAQIAFFLTTLTGSVTIWINPFVSTWSDRHRGRFGRRRPFLFVAAPVSAVLLSVIPFGPDIAHFLGLSPVSGAILLISICYICYAIFNSVIMALFSYYFWDVVPRELVGRFNAMTKIAGLAATFAWQYFFFGMAEKHMKGIFVGIAIFFLLVYIFSLWQVKEGEYPPPEDHKTTGFFAPFRAYFVECFGSSYYLWLYAAVTTNYVANVPGIYNLFYIRDTLKLSLDTIGKMGAFPSIVVAILAFPMGAMIDRLKPERLLAPTVFAT